MAQELAAIVASRCRPGSIVSARSVPMPSATRPAPLLHRATMGSHATATLPIAGRSKGLRPLSNGADMDALAKNCRTGAEMIQKFYAANIKDSLDASSIIVMRPSGRENFWAIRPFDMRSDRHEAPAVLSSAPPAGAPAWLGP